MRSKPFPYCGNTTSDGRDGLRLSGHLQWLISAARGDVSVGIGLLPGDPREEELLLRASFCPVTVFREPVGMLEALGRGDIKAAVRGSLPAGAFLRELKKRRPGVGVRRIAMLALPDGRRFLLGPVGIDEGGTLRGMRMLIEDSRAFCALLGWETRVGVLSAGRPEDVGRGREIARSISRGERLSKLDGVRHFNITIEDALEWANCVIAPDGVAGNLIYRTLVHLGSGSSLGALYFPLDLRLADTSRSGAVSEYIGAIALANISVSPG